MSYHWSGSPDRGALALEPAIWATGTQPRPAAFLDRDGTLNASVPDPDSGTDESPLRTEDVRLLPGVGAATRALAQAGYALVCVTNQPAAAKGKVTVAQLLAIHERVLEMLDGEGVQIDASRLCLHHPEGLSGELSRPCACRKPAPGMLLDSAIALNLDPGSSWMLGDTDSDVLAGRAGGCQTVLIEYPQSAHKRLGGASPDLLAADLADGVAQLHGRSQGWPR